MTKKFSIGDLVTFIDGGEVMRVGSVDHYTGHATCYWLDATMFNYNVRSVSIPMELLVDAIRNEDGTIGEERIVRPKL